MRLLSVATVSFQLSALVCDGAPPKQNASAADRKHAAEAPTLKQFKAAVGTPLFVQQAVGVNALGNVTLTATATAIKQGALGEITFAPALGPSGRNVLGAVSAYLLARHKGWPAGQRIEIAFSTPVAPDDASAAGLATATLLDSMIAGWEADASCVLIGHLQADGRVQNVSSALPRLTSAIRSGASRILIAEKNVPQAADCLVNEGVAGFIRVQIFAVKDFEEIPMMAGSKLDPDVATAMQRFGKAQKLLEAPGADANALLKQPDLQESLRGVLEKWPNHVTARLLLGRGIGHYQTFTLAGSVEAIERIAVTLFQGVNSTKPYEVKNLPLERIDAELATLRRAAERIDPKARPFLDQMIRYGEAARTWHIQTKRTPEDANTLAVTLSTAAALAQDARQNLAAALVQPVF